MKIKSYEKVVLSQSWVKGIIALRRQMSILEDVLSEVDINSETSVDELFNELAQLKTTTENFIKQFN